MREKPAGQQAALVRFGLGGNAEELQIDGWSVPEGGFTWTVGQQSRLRIPYEAGVGTLCLEMTIAPMQVKPAVPHQVLTVMANGVVCGTDIVAARCMLTFPLRHVPSGEAGEIELCLLHPNAAAPADHTDIDDERCLGVAMTDIVLRWEGADPDFVPRRRAALPVPRPAMLFENVRGCTGLEPAPLMLHFESIGHNCEFGLVQRTLEAEQLGLLRFGGIRPDALLRGLRSGFYGVEDPSRIVVTTEQNNGREEYVVRADGYGLQFHSFIATAEVTPAAMVTKMESHLRFLRRMFEERLCGGNTIFVLHHESCRSAAQARPFLHALRGWGATALLFVSVGTGEMGSVDQVAADMFHGHIDRLMGFDPLVINAPAWLSICANTYRLWRESKHNS